MMLRYSLDRPDAGRPDRERRSSSVLAQGLRTGGYLSKPGTHQGRRTHEMGDAVVAALRISNGRCKFNI